MPSRASISLAGRIPRQEPVGRHPRALQRLAHELMREVEALDWRVVDLGGRVVVHDRLARQVAQRHANVLVAEVEPDRERGARDERQQQGRSSEAGFRARSRGRGPRVLLSQAGAHQLLDERRDGRP
jgi:hypothetical protein